MRRLLIWAFALLLLAACRETPPEELSMPEFTGFETEVSADAAVITVSHKGEYGIVEAGILLGTDRIPADTRESGRFTVSLSDLEPATAYTYKAFISSGLQEVLSTEQSFTTDEKPVAVIVDGSSVTVHVDNNLKALLEEYDCDPAGITHLILTGTMIRADFDFIRSRMPQLESVDLRETEVTELPNLAFYGMYALTSALLPDAVTKIGNDAFAETGLTSFHFPESLQTLGEGVFYMCGGLTGELNLPSGLIEIGPRAFESSGFRGDLRIPDSVTKIGEMAFWCTGLDGKLTLGKNLEEIGQGAFNENRLTGEIVIPDKVTEIRENTFGGFEQQYTQVVLPANLRSILNGAFSVLYNLKEVVCHAPVPPVVAEGAFYSDFPKDMTLRVPADAVPLYQEAEGWKVFGSILPIE